MPRFAILTHDHPFLHWDFLLEDGDTCRTWRLLKSPDSIGEIPATVMPAHRLIYLDYEGPVSGNRGTVVSWDAGTFVWELDQPSHLEVILSGRRLAGKVRLIETTDSWTWALLPTSR